MVCRVPYVVLFAAGLPAQVQWQRIEYPPPAAGSVTYDAVRDRYLLLAPPNGLGAPETWEWSRAAGWQRQHPAASPVWRQGGAMVQDPLRNVTVRFSGISLLSTLSFAETYEWNGATWTNVSPAHQPPARYGHALAYDGRRARVVLFGGQSDNPNFGFYSDTWEWNGVVWTQQTGGPSARAAQAMAYDAARGEVVLFGGRDRNGALADTWTRANGVWQQRLVAGPPARFAAAMAFDGVRSRTVLFAGSPTYGTYLDETWEWDGAAWRAMAAPTRPSSRAEPGLAPDPLGGGVLAFGGGDGTSGNADVWRWDGTTWSRLGDWSQPQGRHSHAMAFDEARGDLIVFGGVGSSILGDCWRWNGAMWSPVAATGPSPRSRARMVFDSARNEALLFGGDLPGFTNETWTFDGTSWSRRQPIASPTPRSHHAMAFDRLRARAVLFGGVDTSAGFVVRRDTWEWDGNTWSLRSSGGPPARVGHAMAYDARRGVTVLHGGTAPGPTLPIVLDDTWEWDGLAWVRRLSTTTPGGLAEFAMEYDPVRERVVAFGSTASADAWEWDGSDWTLRMVAAAPPPRSRNAMAFDTWRETVLMFGGQSSGPDHIDLWTYAAAVPAMAVPYGTGCPGATGEPQLVNDGRPWLGSAWTLVLGSGPSSAPSALWLGASATTATGVSLPLDLSPLGAPGCALLASIDVASFAIASPAGVVSLGLVVPNQPWLGVEMYAQGAFLDPSANPAGLVLSRGRALRIGGR